MKNLSAPHAALRHTHTPVLRCADGHTLGHISLLGSTGHLPKPLSSACFRLGRRAEFEYCRSSLSSLSRLGIERLEHGDLAESSFEDPATRPQRHRTKQTQGGGRVACTSAAVGVRGATARSALFAVRATRASRRSGSARGKRPHWVLRCAEREAASVLRGGRS